MKRHVSVLSLALTLLLTASLVHPVVRADAPVRRDARQNVYAHPADFVPGEVLVKFRPGVASAKAEPLNGTFGLVRTDRIEGLEIERYNLVGSDDVWTAVEELRRRPDVLFAEPNFMSYLATVPNDPLYANVDGFARDLQQWTYGGIEGDTGINAEAAWNLTTGRPDVTIAIIDSGVWQAHGDLAPNLWTNTDEIPGNQLDDDGNGFVDDIHGWDFFSNDADPNPDLGDGINNDGAGFGDDNTFHGTFAANMAAGRGNDAGGVCGAAWSCRVMSLKTFGDDGGANNFHIAAALHYAADNGADVINMSLTSRSPSSTIQEGVEYAAARDCVMVAAAGNFNMSSTTWPGGFDDVLAVGATDHAFSAPDLVNAWGPADFDGRPGFTQYGPQAVDVVAPGVVFSSSIASVTDANADPALDPGDVIAFSANGTSFASPIVAGLAALIVSRDKDLNGGVRTLTNSQVIAIIEETAQDLNDDPDDRPDGGTTWDGKGRVDFLAALTRVSGTSGRLVRLAWNAPTVGEVLAPPTSLTVEDQSETSTPETRTERLVVPMRPIPAPAPGVDLLPVDSYSKGAQKIAEVEPNHSLATAQPIGLPTTITGQISTADRGDVAITYGDGSSDVVEDIFRFTLAQQTTLSITLTPDGDSDLDLGLMTDLDGDGEYTFEQQYLSANPADGPQQSEGLANVQLPPGTYYIACTIYDLAPRMQPDTYTLTVSTGGAALTGYRIYRSASPNVTATPANQIAQVAASQRSFLDTTAPEGAVYYVVTALYETGESAPSNEATPGDDEPDPNAPAILNPKFKKGKLKLNASGSKILPGAMLVVGNRESFAMSLNKAGTKWAVKKNTLSNPSGLRIADALPVGIDVTMYVVNTDGLRSATMTFRR